MHFNRRIANIISAVVFNKTKRKKFRTELQFDTKWCLRFVREYCDKIGIEIKKINTYTGRGGKNYIITINNKYVFKCPIQDDANINPIAEQRISDYFSKKVSLIVPKLEIIKYNDIYIKKYDFVDGVVIESADKNLVNKNIDKIANQIADFLFTLSTDDPKQLDDLKPKNAKKPDFMYGWSHNDIGGNFILNPKTMDVVGFIDWEQSTYGDMMPDFNLATIHWGKLGFKTLGIKIMKRYANKYVEYVKHKK